MTLQVTTFFQKVHMISANFFFYVFTFHSNKKDSSNLYINKCKLYLCMLVFGS